MTKTAAILLTALVPFIFLAFWPAYLSRPLPSTDTYTHFHAITGTLWVGLLIAQPIAIHNYKYGLHRMLGRASYVLASGFFVAGILLSHHRLASMDEATFAVEGYSHYLPFYASIVFAAAYLGGLRHRDLADAHGRFMLCTVIPLIDPVIGRVLFFYLPSLPSPPLYQAITFTLATTIAGVLVFSYRGRGSEKRDLILYFVLLVTLEAGWFTVAHTQSWLTAVRWFRSLPLT